jgi:hypothetical protein
MSTLALILVATVVPGDGGEREKASMEMAQALDINGQWEGAVQRNDAGPIEKIKISRGRHYVEVQGKKIMEAPLKIIKEGEGILRWEVMVAGKMQKSLGIYKWQGNRLFICLRLEGRDRPRILSLTKKTVCSSSTPSSLPSDRLTENALGERRLRSPIEAECDSTGHSASS